MTTWKPRKRPDLDPEELLLDPASGALLASVDGQTSVDELARRVGLDTHQVERILSDLVADGRPQVAFAGRSNVGKSSLLNRLLGRKALARISSSPGRTRSINYFLVEERCYFVDLPGYGYAKVAKVMRQAWARRSFFMAAASRSSKGSTTPLRP